MEEKIDFDKINLTIDNVDFWGSNQYNKGGMRIYWSGDIGWGSLDIVKRAGNDGDDLESPEEITILTAHTERMDTQEEKRFIKKILVLLVEFVTVMD